MNTALTLVGAITMATFLSIGLVLIIAASYLLKNKKWYRCPICGRYWTVMGDNELRRPPEALNLPVEVEKCPNCSRP